MAKHEENKDLRIISNHTGINIDWSTHTIEILYGTIVGIRTWGRIDYLTNHCGWKVVKVSTNTPVEEIHKHIRINVTELNAAKTFYRR